MSHSISMTAANRRSPASVKRLTLLATILGSSIALLDGSVVNVALPAIQRSLGGGLAGQQWVSNAYLLTLGSFILLGGSLGGGVADSHGDPVAGYRVAYLVFTAIAIAAALLTFALASRTAERAAVAPSKP